MARLPGRRYSLPFPALVPAAIVVGFFACAIAWCGCVSCRCVDC